MTQLSKTTSFWTFFFSRLYLKQREGKREREREREREIERERKREERRTQRERRRPLDNFELLPFSLPGPEGKTFPLCPYCYNSPPFEDPDLKVKGKKNYWLMMMC
ncbi:hypothetical protein ACSBR2_034394 [Camellia fascicularis]